MHDRISLLTPKKQKQKQTQAWSVPEEFEWQSNILTISKNLGLLMEPLTAQVWTSCFLIKYVL